MRILETLALACGFAVTAGAALAWGDMYMGDATNDPNSNFMVHSYNAPNYCPAGMQPITVGGVVCCGTPNAGAYVDRPGKVHKPRPVAKRKPAPRAYAPVGEKGVVYR